MISADAVFLERKRTAKEFIIASNAVILKAQGLATLVPLYKPAFGLLEGLLDDWHLLNLDLMEWRCKAKVHQACINLWSLNKQAPWVSSALPPTQEQPSQQVAPCNKGKEKAKSTEEDEDEE
ncbi:hypothetical protein C0995_004723, partial [Termitomyces sp. Mi166